jgi:hypothetical protein
MTGWFRMFRVFCTGKERDPPRGWAVRVRVLTIKQEQLSGRLIGGSMAYRTAIPWSGVGSRSFWTILVSVSLLTTGLRADESQKKKAGKTFRSPLKNFSVPVPDLCLGTKTKKDNDKHGGTVAFYSEVGQLLRIDYIRLDSPSMTILREADSASRCDFYKNQLSERLLKPSAATVQAEEVITADSSIMLLTLAFFPKGAVIERAVFSNGHMTREPDDSVRGLLVFVHGEFLYILHNEVGTDFESLWPGCAKSLNSMEERLQAAKVTLQEFYRTITFE